MNRNSLARIEINNFDGLDKLKTTQYATDKTINVIADGKNFVINDGILEVAKSPMVTNISIPEEDKINEVENNIFICNGFGKYYVGNFYHYIYIINGWIYKLIGENLAKIYDKQLNPSAICIMTVYADKLIIQNGIDTPVEFDGSVCKLQEINDPQSIIGEDNKFIGSQIANNSLYYFTKNYIYKPAPNTTNDFDNTLGTVDGFVPHAPQGGDILGLKQLGGKLSIIFMANNQTLKLIGNEPMGENATNPHTISIISNTIGAISSTAYCDTGTEIFFVSKRGVEQLSTVETYGDIEFVNVFNKIRELVLPYVSNEANAKYCFLSFLNDKIHILFRGVNNQSVLFSYDVIYKTIEYSEYKEKFTYMGVIDNVLTFGCEDGKIYNLASDYYNHNECYFEFNFYPTKYGLGTIKKWNKLLVYCETETDTEEIKLSVRHFEQDYISANKRTVDKKIETAATWGSFQYGKAKWGSEGIRLIRFKNLGKSKAIKFRIDTTSPKQHIRIKKIELYYTPMGIVKG